jgi:hypothetical protein
MADVTRLGPDPQVIRADTTKYRARHQRWLAILLVCVVLPVGAAKVFANWRIRRGTSDQQRIFQSFRKFPGAVHLRDAAEEVRFDGERSGQFALMTTYRLPVDATTSNVFAHLRRNVPKGWTVATDATCAEKLKELPTPPRAADGTSVGSATPPPRAEQFLLLHPHSQLTVLRRREADGRVSGVTFSLFRDGGDKILRLGPPTYGCGRPDGDPVADDFNTPGKTSIS